MGLFNKKELLRIQELETELFELKELQKALGINDYIEAHNRIEKEKKDALDLEQKLTFKNEALENKITLLTEKFSSLTEEVEKEEKKLESSKNKLDRTKYLYKALEYSIKKYDEIQFSNDITVNEELLAEVEQLKPTVTLHLNCLNVQELKKAYRENEKQIDKTLESYKGRYTTKANQAIYKLMVIALQAELQNILSELKYSKLDDSLKAIMNLCQKYLVIAADGNQSIAGTLKKFIGEIELLFINAVKIEYEYHVKKEREREEQAAIREQMRQEAEERRILEQQRIQVEKEESKYLTEIENTKNQLSLATDNTKIEQLNNKIKELELLLSKVEEKKEEIINRQNGKAGNVYIISNLGSFGDEVFKIGMTRRLEPMDRIKELGDASVPFSYDVHAMIFSEDAVSLESKLHNILDKKRLNKVNLRKEFFKVSLDEIEQIVLSEDPSIDFNRTLVAEQYRQSLSIGESNQL